MKNLKLDCKYWNTCGNKENCLRCNGYEKLKDYKPKHSYSCSDEHNG